MKLKLTHPEQVETLGILSSVAKKPSICSGDILRMMKPIARLHPMEDIETSIRCTWAGVQWIRSGKPIFRLDEDLLSALVNTKPPKGRLATLPELPFLGIYIALDGERSFYLEDPSTGLHKAEGIYICKDLLRTVVGGKEIAEGLLVLAIGENKGASDAPLERDDSIHYFGLIPGMLLGNWHGQHTKGLNETLGVVLNLLFLLSSEKDALSMKEVVPPKPKSPKKRKRAARKKISFEKYYRLGLSEKVQRSMRAAQEKTKSDWDGPTHVSVVVGHWHKYWVKDATGRPVFDRKVKGDVTYHLIRKWVHPYPAIRRGPDPKRNVYKVVK